MATTFPTSKQTFTDPTSGQTLAAAGHAQLHTDINDTVEALQDEVLAGSGTYLSKTAAPQWVELAPVIALQGATTLGGANEATFTQFLVRHPIVVNRITLTIGTSSGNIDVGIYDDDGAGGAPSTRLVSAGSTPCPAAGAAAITVTETELAPGRYWAALAADNLTATFQFGRIAGGTIALTPNRYTRAASFPLPATATSPTASTAQDVYLAIPGRA